MLATRTHEGRSLKPYKELGAASTLHRVSHLEKRGHKDPTSPPNLEWHWVHLNNWTEAEPVIPHQKGLLLERRPVSSELLAARFSPSISVVEDKVPLYQRAMSEGSGGAWYRFLARIYSNMLHSVPCDITI